MQFHVDTFLEFFGSAIIILAFWAVAGAPIAIIGRRLGVRAVGAVPLPLLGLVTLIAVSWWWATPLGPVEPVTWIMLAVGIASIAVDGALRWRSGDRSVTELVGGQERHKRATIMAITLGGIAIIVTMTMPRLFTADHPPILTAGNNDVVAYVLHAEHLKDHGPNEPGNIAGYDIGARSLGFANGSLSGLASAATITGQDTWTVAQSTFTVTIALACWALALLFHNLLRGQFAAMCACAAVVGFAGFYTTYLISAWYLAQFIGLAIATAIAAILVVAVREQGRRGYVTVAIVAGLFFVAGLATYPHMVVFGSLCLLPLVVLSNTRWQAIFRNSARALLLWVSAFALSVVSALGLARAALDATTELGSVVAGWKLESISVAEVLGFQTIAKAEESTAWTPIISMVILGVLVGASVILWRRSTTVRGVVLGLASVVAITLVSAQVMLTREGDATYRYWKWITFFIPLAVGASALLILLLGPSASDRKVVWTRVTTGVVAALFGFGLLMSSAAGFGYKDALGEQAGKPGLTGLTVTSDMAELETDPALESVDDLHIAVTPYWETMWLAYFLRDKHVTLGAESYLPITPQRGEWRIERNDAPAPAAGTRVVKVNDTYRLVGQGPQN